MSQVKVPARSIGFTICWAFAQETLEVWQQNLTSEEHQGCLSPQFFLDLNEVDDCNYVG